MSYSILDTTGAAKSPAKGDKLTLDTDGGPLYLTGIKPFAHTEDSFELIDPALITVSPFASMNASGVPTYGTNYTLKADVHWKIGKEWNEKLGANTVVSLGYLCAAHAPTALKRKGVKLTFHDSLEGLMFPGECTVVFQAVTYPSKDRYGNLGAPTLASPRTLNCEVVEMQEGLITKDRIMLKEGLGMIEVTRDQITREEAEGIYNYFTISLDGATPIKYTVWNADGGGQQGSESVVVAKTHHLRIYLARALD